MTRPTPGDTTEVPFRFSRADFDEFARLSGDDNPIHVDPEFCSRTRFGKPVAHGMLLFGVLDAAVNRWLGGPLAVWCQELTFRAPTFADDDLKATLRVETTDDHSVRIGEWIHRSDGTETAGGYTVVGTTDAPPTADGNADAPARDSEELHGIRPGMTAMSTRAIPAEHVGAYWDLVNDPHPRCGPGDVVPPALLGGLISHLLGVELPGRGTNWLRQRYTFHAPVPVGVPIDTRVEVTRVRPEKALVDLVTTCTVGDRAAVTGEALVLVADLESQ